MNMTRTRFHASNGFSVMEVIVAIGIVAIVSAAAFSLLAASLRVNRNIRNALVASSLAEEGMELVRSIRDSNWVTGNIGDGTTCTAGSGQWRQGLCPGTYIMNYSDTALQSGSFLLYRRGSSPTGYYTHSSVGNAPTPFRREITITNATDDPLTSRNETIFEVIVAVRVYWCRKGDQPCPVAQENSLHVEERLRNWLGT